MDCIRVNQAEAEETKACGERYTKGCIRLAIPRNVTSERYSHSLKISGSARGRTHLGNLSKHERLIIIVSTFHARLSANREWHVCSGLFADLLSARSGCVWVDLDTLGKLANDCTWQHNSLTKNYTITSFGAVANTSRVCSAQKRFESSTSGSHRRRKRTCSRVNVRGLFGVPLQITRILGWLLAMLDVVSRSRWYVHWHFPVQHGDLGACVHRLSHRFMKGQTDRQTFLFCP